MRYLLIYRGYPKKSIQNATATFVNKMTPDELGRYIKLPMTGTLEEVLRRHVEENKINKKDVKTLANAFGLNANDLFRPDLRSENSRHKGKGVQANSTVSVETKNRIERFAESENFTSLDAAIDVLIQTGLTVKGF